MFFCSNNPFLACRLHYSLRQLLSVFTIFLLPYSYFVIFQLYMYLFVIFWLFNSFSTKINIFHNMNLHYHLLTVKSIEISIRNQHYQPKVWVLFDNDTFSTCPDGRNLPHTFFEHFYYIGSDILFIIEVKSWLLMVVFSSNGFWDILYMLKQLTLTDTCMIIVITIYPKYFPLAMFWFIEPSPFRKDKIFTLNLLIFSKSFTILGLTTKYSRNNIQSNKNCIRRLGQYTNYLQKKFSFVSLSYRQNKSFIIKVIYSIHSSLQKLTSVKQDIPQGLGLLDHQRCFELVTQPNSLSQNIKWKQGIINCCRFRHRQNYFFSVTLNI